MAIKKERADQLLLDQGLVDNLRLAQALIMAGKVFTEKEEKILTVGQAIDRQESLYIKGQEKEYVSRGAYKLKKALSYFDLSVEGLIALDIGSSTGGFTDVLLQEGARLVYAVDVGTNQLDWSLRQDERVVVMEQTNFRYAKPEDFKQGLPDFACADVSFISLKLILPALKDILKPEGHAVALIKPQFEADKEEVGEKGVVSDPTVHERVLRDICDFAQKDYCLHSITDSPITGREGNREFLVHLQKTEAGMNFNLDLAIQELLYEGKQ